MKLQPCSTAHNVVGSEAFPFQKSHDWFGPGLFCTLITLPSCTLALVAGLKGKQGGEGPVNNWWLWWRQLLATGRVCERTGALLALSTQTRCARWRHFLCSVHCVYVPVSSSADVFGKLREQRASERRAEILLIRPVSGTVGGHLLPDVYSAWVNCLFSTGCV